MVTAECTDEHTVLRGEPAPGVVRLMLNRPTRLNALTAALLETLYTHLCECRDNDAVRCVLIVGAGRSFCAGQDLNDRDPRKRDELPDLETIQKEHFHPVVSIMGKMEKPVIVAVQGVAAGAGSSIALSGDIVLAARSAKFVQSFSKVGLSVDAGAGWQLARALGPARARGLLMTGGTLSGDEAAQAGLIWKCVSDDALANEALTLSATLATGPTRAFAAIKSAIAKSGSASSFEHYLEYEARLQGQTGRTGDYPEGVLAFLEKRAPVFQGK